MSDLDTKLREAENFLQQVQQQLLELRNAEQQVIGRIQTYKELLEEAAPTQVVDTTAEVAD